MNTNTIVVHIPAAYLYFCYSRERAVKKFVEEKSVCFILKPITMLLLKLEQILSDNWKVHNFEVDWTS